MRKVFGWAAVALLILAIVLKNFIKVHEIFFWVALAASLVSFAVFTFMGAKRAGYVEKRKIYFGLNVLLTIIITVAILVVVNYFFYKFHKRFDLTAEKVHSLSPQSVKVIKNLDKKVELIAFYPEADPERARAKELFELYRYVSDKVSYKIIDPYKSPEAVKEFGTVRLRSVVVRSGDQETRVNTVTEEEITNAIIKVTRHGKKKVYVVKGHGEYSIEDFGEKGLSTLKEAMQNLGYIVEELVLAEGDVPEDASVLVIPGPKTDFLDIEVKRLEKYLNNGGNAVFLIDPMQKEAKNLYGLLKKFGVKLENWYIVDVYGQILGGSSLVPVVVSYKYHPITKDFKIMTFYPLAQVVQLVSPMPEGVEAKILCETSQNSWAKKELSRDMNYNPDTDIKGPLPVAAAVEFRKEDKKGRIVVFGDSDFVTNSFYYQQGNGNLFENSLNWTTEEEDLIAITAKTMKPTTLVLTKSQERLTFYTTIVILPGLFFLLGIFIWRKRRWL